ncbi:MAG: FAD-binding oxidoreductase [Halothiobacillaceae bacterium]
MSTEDRFLSCLEAAVGPQDLRTATGDCWPYGMDNSRRHALPRAVLLASSHEQLAAAVRICAQFAVPLTTRGRGTGTAGGAVPEHGGLVISLERMDRVKEFVPEDRLIVVEAGITNARVQETIGEAGFFWPPDPTSSAICTVGGNIACNAAGPKAVKYGTTREHVLGLRAITGLGQTLRTGTRTTKGVVGYDLTRLLIGSEGTLGLVTEATLKLTPRPEARRMFRVLYQDMRGASRGISRLMAQPVVPSALEFIDGMALALLRRHRGVDIPEAAGAMLMVEIDGTEAAVTAGTSAILRTADGPGCLEVRAATDDREAAQLWAARKALSPTLRHLAPKKINEDVVVPVSRIPELTDTLQELAHAQQLTIASFGHAGNGNLHVNLMVDPDDPEQMKRADIALDAVFWRVLELGGTLSGEHGIGRVKRAFVPMELDPVALNIMHGIRQVLDPHGILNPGSKLPQVETT